MSESTLERIKRLLAARDAKRAEVKAADLSPLTKDQELFNATVQFQEAAAALVEELVNELEKPDRPKIHILHERYSDSDCAHQVYVDGEKITQFQIADVDEGKSEPTDCAWYDEAAEFGEHWPADLVAAAREAAWQIHEGSCEGKCTAAQAEVES